MRETRDEYACQEMLKVMYSAPDASECVEIEFKTFNFIKLVSAACRKLVKHGAAALCGNGGMGRHHRLKICCRKA